MSNRFQKAAQQPKVTAGGHKPDPKPEPEKIEEKSVAAEQTPAVEQQQSPVAEEKPRQTLDKDFLAKFVEPKKDGKSHSIYLSNEAGKKLEKLAKQMKCSKSKALDILLKNMVD